MAPYFETAEKQMKSVRGANHYLVNDLLVFPAHTG